jgi:hypothetical protein
MDMGMATADEDEILSDRNGLSPLGVTHRAPLCPSVPCGAISDRPSSNPDNGPMPASTRLQAAKVLCNPSASRGGTKLPRMMLSVSLADAWQSAIPQLRRR